ncbi:fibrinogen-like protein A [Anopheles ziemanni]|uniref:fibrinogen-like protein A n=1 Tax=Anopheles coustani TaxID=139045 RepID=UPI00265AEDCF|nr:fibrinogen-like protein A [Anopheles coustani]XP_058178933.1 fibrinogen-like protein A [Anopheles ziemanni]
MAIGGFEMELLMTKLDYLQDKLQEVEQTMKSSLKVNNQHKLSENTMIMEKNVDSLYETEHLQEKLTKHENNINEKIETIEAKMHAMEDSLKKSLEASEENTRTKLEELKNHMIPKMDLIQETLQTELKKLEENKEILDMLTNSIYNLTTNAETRSKTLEDHLIAPIRSCRQAANESGTYLLSLSKKSKPFEVFCEQNKFEGNWTVIQHRFDGSVDFYRNWTEYRNGFGNVDGEFWLGLEYVHQITKNRPHELLVEVKDFHGNYGYAKYGEFEIGDESEKYVLKKLGTYSGTAGDSMQTHKNKKFSTFGRDNDNFIGSCATKYHGAWWYNDCLSSNLNGRYQNTTGDASAMSWFHFKNDRRGLSYSRMMIRDIIN